MKFRNLNADEIECRVSTIKKNGLSLLLYKDARCDMRILDEIVGMEYWQREHREVKGNIYCGVSLYLQLNENDWQWVTKWDAGAESYTEKVKGEASDSFKRACFNWGIGRELYTAPFIWITPDNDNEIKQKQNSNSYTTYSKFTVSDIEYKENAICYLEIIDQNGKVRFKYGNPTLITKDQLIEIDNHELDQVKIGQWKNYFKVSKLESITKKQATFMLDKLRRVSDEN